MTDGELTHTHLDGIADYTAALDALCGLAHRTLYLFEKDFDGLGFNAEARYETLRHFLLSNPANRLYVLAHDMHYLSARCPRMMMLKRQFGPHVLIQQTHQQHATAPFSVTDNAHYVRRFHFDDPRGIFALNDPEKAHELVSIYNEMWSKSHPSSSISTFEL